jgi:hypothetical protein
VIDRLLAPFRDRPRRVPRVRYLIRAGRSAPLELVVDGRRRSDATSPAEAIDLLLWDVYDRAFRGASEGVVIHAGLVSLRGRGVLLPGRPDAGKTTLVAALVRAGFAYLSDEAAIFDPETGRFLAFPRPLGMERPTLRLFPGLEERLPAELRGTDRMTRHVPATAIRRGCIGRSCVLRHVVVPEYRAGASTRLEPIGRAETLLLLSRSAFSAERFASQGLDAMATSLAGADCHRLPMGDLPGAVDAVVSLAGRPGGQNRRRER